MGENEKVLAVSRKILFGENDERAFEGFLFAKQFHKNVFDLTRNHGQYLWRYGPDGIEENSDWKQIIPYVLFRHNEKYFLYARLKGDERLVSKLSIGIGGHITPNDKMKNNLEIFDGLRREWLEEISYKGKFQPKLLGFLNLSKTPVDRVHFGLVFLVEGDSSEIDIHPNERKHNRKMGLSDLAGLRYYSGKDIMEDWSRVLIEEVL